MTTFGKKSLETTQLNEVDINFIVYLNNNLGYSLKEKVKTLNINLTYPFKYKLRKNYK